MTSRRRMVPLAGYMAAVCVIGLPMLVLLTAHLDFEEISDRPGLYLPMALVLIAGEMLPIPVPRRDEAGDEVTISSTVALALTMIAPPGFAVLAQALALAADEARSRRNWGRLAFNIAQYTLALYAARVVYQGVQGRAPASWHPHLPASALPDALVAALAFFLVNNTLTAVAVALKVRIPISRQLLGDFRYQIGTSGVLLALAPVTAIAVDASPWTLPILLLPIAAVHRSARLAYVREHEALHDSLTGLANRSLFNARLEQACEDAHRSPIGLLLIDIDHFKDTNDTLGHHAGDLLLREMAVRLRHAVREGDLVARLGGDEFAVLAAGVATPEQLQPVLTRVQHALHGYVVLNGVQVDLSASVGIALAPTDGDVAELLLQRADIALYAAKRNRGSSMFYELQDDEHSVERLSLLGELRRGIDAGQVFLVYQPKLSLETSRVVGVEALVRWDHPTLGTLAPSRFVPLAENTGLIDSMTVAMLDLGLRELAELDRNERDLTLAVNLSARLLSDLSFVEMVAAALTRHSVPPARLTLEVTESMIMADTERTFAAMRALREIGVQISIDDFGTGYSSLAYLKRLAVDELKIDRTFITGLAEDEHDAKIAEIAVELGHHFGLVVVAEGVEDQETMHALRRLGCDVVQGYHVAQPMRFDDLRGWLAARSGAAALAGRAG